MQKHLQTLISLLQKNDLSALRKHYLNSSEIENTLQLGFMFQQGEIKSSNYGYYQQLATSFIETKGVSNSLIAKIQTSSTLSFFTPALQLVGNFKQTDEHQRNVLHYLFTNNKMLLANGHPPFNYLRSMMLFGSNNALCDALCQRDKQELTPIETYLFTNKNLTPLANQELTALFALIEIEHKQQEALQANYPLFIKNINNICKDQKVLASQDLQRILFIATYYTKSIQDVYRDIGTN